MAKTTMRMKNKVLSKFHLNGSGAMVLSTQPAASDLVSKGITAQPAGPMTAEENVGLSSLPPSSTSSTVTEGSTGAPAERVAPETMVEVDKQPEMKELEQAPIQDAQPVAGTQPTPEAPAQTPATPYKVPVATAESVLKTETAADATMVKTGDDASTSVGGKLETAV